MEIIRSLKTEEDLSRVMDIWLKSNLDSHDFIDQEYWKDSYDYVRKGIAEAEVYLYLKDDQVVGFIGIIDNYIEGIFIDSDHRGRGIGQHLLNSVKARYDSLELDVYKKNKRACDFYLKNGFIPLGEGFDEANSEKELKMIYER